MLNHFVGMGRIVADPELKTTTSGVPVVSFTLAVERDHQQNGNRQTDFINCTAWRNTAEFISKYFHKGSMTVVEGRLQSRKWEDKNGGKRTEWEIQVDSVYFGESKKDSGTNYAPNISTSDFEDLADEEELPF